MKTGMAKIGKDCLTTWTISSLNSQLRELVKLGLFKLCWRAALSRLRNCLSTLSLFSIHKFESRSKRRLAHSYSLLKWWRNTKEVMMYRKGIIMVQVSKDWQGFQTTKVKRLGWIFQDDVVALACFYLRTYISSFNKGKSFFFRAHNPDSDQSVKICKNVYFTAHVHGIRLCWCTVERMQWTT